SHFLPRRTSTRLSARGGNRRTRNIKSILNIINNKIKKMDIEFMREFIEVFTFFAIVSGGAYVLVVKLSAKATGREN
ncbi:MAG: hypothetical protein KAQ64_04870, partial [Candidatus Pacebacteria bacterium]|nr:hypothetical protein [Candidatus Paceibacterota bacterium]